MCLALLRKLPLYCREKNTSIPIRNWKKTHRSLLCDVRKRGCKEDFCWRNSRSDEGPCVRRSTVHTTLSFKKKKKNSFTAPFFSKCLSPTVQGAPHLHHNVIVIIIINHYLPSIRLSIVTIIINRSLSFTLQSGNQAILAHDMSIFHPLTINNQSSRQPHQSVVNHQPIYHRSITIIVLRIHLCAGRPHPSGVPRRWVRPDVAGLFLCGQRPRHDDWSHNGHRAEPWWDVPADHRRRRQFLRL